MNKAYIITFFVLTSFISFAQQATEIDSKSVRFPRYANLTAITTAIPSPTQGMEVYNIGTQSNWYFNGTAWTNTNAGGFVLPYAQTQNFTGDLFSITNTSTVVSTNPLTITSAITGVFNGSNNISTSIPFAAGVKGIVPNSASLIGGTAAGVYGYGQNPNSYGVYGRSNGYYGVYGESDYIGVAGSSYNGKGGWFISTTGNGVEGNSDVGTGGRFSSISGNALVTTTGNIVLGGFTQLGGTDVSVPKIKIKKLTHMTPATTAPNTFNYIAHGLTSSKIISIDAIVTSGSYRFIPNTPSRLFTINIDDLSNQSTPSIAIGVGSVAESIDVMGKSITIIITYEE